MITAVSPRPIFEGDQFQGSFAVITDITEQKKLQQQRREERDFLSNIFLTTNDGFVVSDTGGTIVRVNTTIEKMLGHQEGVVMATRIDKKKAAAVCESFPSVLYYKDAKMLVARAQECDPEKDEEGTIAVVAAGTSDIPVAEEALVTARSLGNRVKAVYDVGVAGIHRLYARQKILHAANVLIVVAGMEGALPSVVGGLFDKPVIAVPTSVGYGTGFGGFAALLGMLNSCTPGVAVVNIDNGFGAGCVASLILRNSIS